MTELQTWSDAAWWDESWRQFRDKWLNPRPPTQHRRYCDAGRDPNTFYRFRRPQTDDMRQMLEDVERAHLDLIADHAVNIAINKMWDFVITSRPLFVGVDFGRGDDFSVGFAPGGPIYE